MTILNQDKIDLNDPETAGIFVLIHGKDYSKNTNCPDLSSKKTTDKKPDNRQKNSQNRA